LLAVDDLSCREFVALVTDYLEGALSDRLRARFDRHLAECPHCVTYLEQMRDIIVVAGRLAEEDLSEPAREALLEAFRAWKADEISERSANEPPEDTG